MSDKRSKVTAHLDKPVTTIVQETGDIAVTRKGVMKGFREGFQDYLKKGNVTQSVGAEVNVGQFPPGHKDEGKWAVQIMLSSFDTQDLANEYADRVTPIIEGVLGAKAFKPQ
jgi:hypothetical protein